MRISCVCPTFNRIGAKKFLIDECVESFLRQVGHDDLELIIWNDHPNQRVVFEHPKVRVFNTTRVSTLGEKYNQMIEAATGDGILPWEDDDICLPRRAADAAAMLEEFDYAPHGYFFLDGGGLHVDHPLGYCHGSGAYRKSAWAKVGGYPKVSGPQDAAMDGKLRASVRTRPGAGTRADWQYIYRWGVSTMHLSAMGSNGPKEYDEYVRRTDGGEIVVEPRWLKDYSAMCDEVRG